MIVQGNRPDTPYFFFTLLLIYTYTHIPIVNNGRGYRVQGQDAIKQVAWHESK